MIQLEEKQLAELVNALCHLRSEEVCTNGLITKEFSNELTGVLSKYSSKNVGEDLSRVISAASEEYSVLTDNEYAPKIDELERLRIIDNFIENQSYQ